MESYILRVYREPVREKRGIIGIIEEIGANEKRAFTNVDELWELLTLFSRGPQSKQRKRKK